MKTLFLTLVFAGVALAQSISCVVVYGTPAGTSGGSIPARQLMCQPVNTLGVAGPQGPVGPQGIPGPTGPQGPQGPQGTSGSGGGTFTGGPCSAPAAGVNLYAKLADGSCLLVIAVPAANFVANGVVHFGTMPFNDTTGSNGTVLPRFLDSPSKGFLVYAMTAAQLGHY